MAKKTTKKAAEKIVEKTVTKRSYPLLEIRQREGSEGLMVGANTELLIDGKPVKGAQRVSFEVNARGVATATITLVGRFKVSGRVKSNKVKLYK